MKINKTEYSFEESLKYLDFLAQQMTDEEDIPEIHNLNVKELPVHKVITAYCATMYIRVIRRVDGDGRGKEYAFRGAISQIVKLLENSDTLRHLDLQADGSIMALFDTPMKKNVEELIILAAQVRSINDVVLTKFHMDLGRQHCAVGLDYGAVSYFSTANSSIDPICYQATMKWAKQLAEQRDDSVIISDDIYINLSEDMQKNLFKNSSVHKELKYHYAPLINIRMDKWVKEQR